MNGQVPQPLLRPALQLAAVLFVGMGAMYLALEWVERERAIKKQAEERRR